MILTLASSSKVGYIAPTLLQAISRSLCLVVILLLINTYKAVKIFFRHTIPVTNSRLGMWYMTYGTITGNDVGSLLQYS